MAQAPAPSPSPAQAFPLDPVLYYSRGWDFYNRQDYDRAISEYNEAIKLEPDNATYYFARGVAYLDTNDYDKAISDYNEAIRLEPDNAGAYNNRGTAYYETEKYDKAISDYNKAIKLEPHFSAAYYNRGITLSKAGQGRSGSGRFRQSEAARLHRLTMPVEFVSYARIVMLCRSMAADCFARIREVYCKVKRRLGQENSP